MSEELNNLKQEIIAEAIKEHSSIKLLDVMLDNLIIKAKSAALDEVIENRNNG
jgi:hypothetical protein